MKNLNLVCEAKLSVPSNANESAANPSGLMEARVTTWGAREGADGRKFNYQPEGFMQWAEDFSKTGRPLPMYVNHQSDAMPVGEWTSFEFDDTGMTACGRMYLNTTCGSDLYQVMSESPNASLQPINLQVPADMSSAAFFMTAAALVPNSQITLESVGINPTRTGLFDLLQAMGADVHAEQKDDVAGEPVGDVTVKSSALRATTIEGPVVVRAIDELPVLAVAATQAVGTTVVRDARELRVKETDRIAAPAVELRKLGARIDEYDDGFGGDDEDEEGEEWKKADG